MGSGEIVVFSWGWCRCGWFWSMFVGFDGPLRAGGSFIGID